MIRPKHLQHLKPLRIYINSFIHARTEIAAFGQGHRNPMMISFLYYRGKPYLYPGLPSIIGRDRLHRAGQAGSAQDLCSCEHGPEGIHISNPRIHTGFIRPDVGSLQRKVDAISREIHVHARLQGLFPLHSTNRGGRRMSDRGKN
jgi:hypothetical protein